MIFIKEVHQSKHSSPKDVTDDGIVIFVKEVQALKHLSPNAVTKYKHWSLAFTFLGTLRESLFNLPLNDITVAVLVVEFNRYRKPLMVSTLTLPKMLLVTIIITTINKRHLKKTSLTLTKFLTILIIFYNNNLYP